MTTREIAGKTVHFDEEGFMTRPRRSGARKVAKALADEIGIGELTATHWQVIELHPH